MSKALELADLLRAYELSEDYVDATKDAAAELRRLDAEVKTLKGELELWQNPNRSVTREMAALVAENKWLAAEVKTLRDGLRVYQTQLEKDTNESDLHALMRQGVEIAELKAENKTLRGALQALVDADAPDYIKSSLWDNARAAIKWSDYEPN